MYNIILRNFYKQAEPSLQVVIALAKVGSTFLDREKTLHNHLLFKNTKFDVRKSLKDSFLNFPLYSLGVYIENTPTY